MPRYFSKLYPNQPFIIKATGKRVPIEAIDEKIGVVRVENLDVIAAIETAIRRNQSGFEEISEERYTEFQTQKKSTLNKPWREELSKRGVERDHQVAPKKPRAAVAEVAAEPVAPPPASVPVGFRPKASPRNLP